MSIENRPAISRQTGVGLLAGLLASYPISYYFQPALLRMMLSVPSYISHAGDMIRDKELRPAVLMSALVCSLAGGAIGYLIEKHGKGRE
jgi:hypothetical protein